MSIALKDYQERSLGTLREFLRQCARDGRPEAGFQAAHERAGRVPVPYVPVVAEGLASGLPYVCLRVPTGGGKTLLACHAVGLVQRELLHSERAVVLWLVPSQTILSQTAEALRDVRHPYRRALDLGCGPIEIVTIDDALRVSRATVDGNTVVIVSTIQAFRVEDTTGRKVYEQNGTFTEHLLNVPKSRRADLLPGPDGKPLPSLVNMLRLRRPIVVVDEAHNARTDLSFATLGAVMPACIVEFTATPARTKQPSNVLHHVSAAELKAAQMVKLPLRVMTRHPSQRDQLLAEALDLRAQLEKIAGGEAQATGEYLRPILLLQAERVDACEPLRERLVADFGLDSEAVKISVGSLDELPSAEEIKKPSCPVRVIITVQKLREGWDCPFAYVLCSLRETRSATAIEQIVGRVLRLPNAVEKRHPDLNCAYVFSVSASVHEVLSELRDALETNGFSAAEAERIILPVPQGVLPLGVQPQTIRLHADELDSAAAQFQVSTLSGKAELNSETGEITVFVPLDNDETARLASCAKTPEAKAKIVAAVTVVREIERAFGGSGHTRTPSAFERRQPFAVPLLCVREGEILFEFESTILLEHPWKLSAKDASLSPTYDPRCRPAATAGTVDIDRTGKVLTGAVNEQEGDYVRQLHQHVLALGAEPEWTEEALIGWLDRNIDHRDIPAGESAQFLRKVINGQKAKHGFFNVTELALDRYRLRDEIAARIQEHRNSERKAAFQALLLPDSPLVVSDTQTIDFLKAGYEPSWVYEGGFQFRKHYFGAKPGELREKTANGELTEEFRCAQWLDNCDAVKFWVRNLARKSTSFRLQTSSDWFYPDFVCQLNDGRVLVVEYKGEHLDDSADAQEKRALGAVWAARSAGHCLFSMPSKLEFSSLAALLTPSRT
jgi:type III restriction enzyme